MKPKKLPDMTIAELIDRFVMLALAQDTAQLYEEYSEYNRLYDQMSMVIAELKQRPGDGRSALLRLLNHENAQVSLKAAIATLAIAPDAARQTLEALDRRNRYPQAADARGMLEALDEGRYIPS